MAVLVCDLAGRIITRNATYETLFADPAPHRLLHLRDLFDQRSRAQLLETIANAFGSLSQGRDGIAELVAGCRKADQLPLQCHVVVRIVASPEQASAHLVVVLRPLHESARQIERLRRSEHRFNILLGHLPVGILGSDSGLRADYVNATVADTFGVGPELLLGRAGARRPPPRRRRPGL